MLVAEQVASISAAVEELSVDEIKERLGHFVVGMTTKAVSYAPGMFLYRARKLGRDLDKQNLVISDLHYRRTGVRLGRANRQDAPMFYASTGKEPVFYEMRVGAGDELLIGNWQLTSDLLVNTIGYTDQVFKSLGAVRPCPVWEKGKEPQPQPVPEEMRLYMEAALRRLKQEDPNFDIVETFSREFTRCDEKMYKVSAAIAELHLGEILDSPARFGGVIYPSIQMSANSDNFAILPSFADMHLALKGVLHVRVGARDGAVISFDELDYAVDFGGDGKIIWHGGPPSMEVPPGGSAEFYEKAGIDEFGFYSRTQAGEPYHWVAIDRATGEHKNFRRKSDSVR